MWPMIEILKEPLIIKSLIAICLSSLLSGIIGSILVVKKMGQFAGGIAHAVLGGLGIAVFFNLSLNITAFFTAIISALIIGIIYIKGKLSEDTAISMVWAAGMAIGVIFMSKSPGYNTNIFSYLFGNILLVSNEDIYILISILLLNISIILFLFQHIKAICFDMEFSRVLGLRTNLIYFIILFMIAISIVAIIKVSGIILVIAFLSIPVALSFQFSKKLSTLILYSSILNIIFSIIGFFIAYRFDLPPGPTIVIIGIILYLISNILKSII